MKKTKILALCASSPLLISSIPLFSTSCSSTEQITVNGEKQFADRSAFLKWKDGGLAEGGMLKEFVDGTKQWTTTDFDTSCCTDPDTTSTFNSNVLDQFDKNFSVETARAALAYSVAQSCAYDINLMNGVAYPAKLTYSINVRYDKNNKAFSGVINTNFGASNNVSFSSSVYMPDPLSIAAEYGQEIDGVNHNVVVLHTKNNKDTVQSQSHATTITGSSITTTLLQSYVRLDFTVFFQENSTLKSFVGPNKSDEIYISPKKSPSSATKTLEIDDDKIFVKTGSPITDKSQIAFDICFDYDSITTEDLLLRQNISIEKAEGKFIITNNNPEETPGVVTWPSKMYLNAYVTDRTGNWVVCTPELY